MRVQAADGWLDMWYYNYGVYSLQDWVGWGWMNNRQTGGATLRTLDASGRLIHCYDSDPIFIGSNVYWTPVYYIQLSPNRC